MISERETGRADALLERAHRERLTEEHRGRLHIFFGYAAGVGKTYRMLQAVRQKRDDGTDVVIGYIEPHARPETLELLEGIAQIDPKPIAHSRITVREPDFDAILARKPDLVVLDELPHTNATGMRHRKRYQYLDELLAAGIDVLTTMNVQHLESLNDVVASITGVIVRETVPDSVFFDAWRVELVDIEPQQLIERFKEGKVYGSIQAHHAMERFFTVKNLAALREIALRAAADRVGRSVESERRAQPGDPVWATSERVLVAVGGSPWSARLVRAAQRLASSLHAPWIALHIVTHDSFSTTANRERIRRVLRLAESLGAETATVRGERSAEDVLAFARARNVTKIVAGKETHRNRLARLFRPSVVDSLLQLHGEVDVYLVHGDTRGRTRAGGQAAVEHPAGDRPVRKEQIVRVMRTLLPAALIMTSALVISLVLDKLGVAEASIVMINLLGAFLSAVFLGWAAGITASVWAMLQFDFFFTAPRYTFIVYDVGYVPVFGIMLIVGLVAASLASRLKRQYETIRRQEAQTYQMYLLGQSLADATSIGEMLRESCRGLSEIYGLAIAIFLPDQAQRLVQKAASQGYQSQKDEQAALRWSFEHGRSSGAGTDTLSKTPVRYEPIRSGDRMIGVAGFSGAEASGTSAELLQLNTALSLVGQAIEREWLLDSQRRASIEVETERFRSSLLRSVSHDLRTPLSGIAGSAEALRYARLESDAILPIAADIETEALRLSLLVENILNLTRLQEDPTRLRLSTESVDDLVYAVAETARSRYRERKITLSFDQTMRVVEVDSVLIRQVLLNLVDNADKYSPPDLPIELSTESSLAEARIVVRDHGPGVPEHMRQRIFEKFIRAETEGDQARGSGLGLYICALIAKAHGGRVFSAPAEGGGSLFILGLPLGNPDTGDIDG